MTQPARRCALAATALLIALLGVSGCARRPAVRFVAQGGVVATATADAVAQKADLGAAASVDVADASSARTTALAALRRDGAEAGKAADTLTRVFPLDTRAVPVLVEGARMNGEDVWLVVEAWGDRTGKLTHRRLWALSRAAGDVRYYRAWK